MNNKSKESIKNIIGVEIQNQWMKRELMSKEPLMDNFRPNPLGELSSTISYIVFLSKITNPNNIEGSKIRKTLIRILKEKGFVIPEREVKKMIQQIREEKEELAKRMSKGWGTWG